MRPQTLLVALLCFPVLAGAAVRPVPPKAVLPQLQTPAPTGRIVIKFQDGVSVKPGGLFAESAVIRTRLEALISRVAPGVKLERHFKASPDALDALCLAAEKRSRKDLPDLNGYAVLDPGTKDPDRLVAIVREMSKDPAVETAFLEPVAVPAAIGFDAFTGQTPSVELQGTPAPAVTPDFSSQQDYRESPPNGVGATDVVGTPGADGSGVKVMDVEGAWLWTHEDLPSPFATIDTPVPSLSWRNHGTAVLGEIRGTDNGLGVLGIAPACSVGGSAINNQTTSEAILAAAQILDPGDVILIELHAPGPNATGAGQVGYVPMEFWQDNFDAIQLATALGIIVCEAAGNGAENLDAAVYQDLFDRNVRDSGAILCGASNGASLSPAGFSNNGTRVDLHGWGFTVTTCGYGNLQGGAETVWYTGGFSGTSSASPIVVGAVVALQGMAEAEFGFPIDAFLARSILSSTGTPQNPGNIIGPRPNLAPAWALASAGIGAVEGTITELIGGLPIEGARVEVLETGAVTQTTAAGEYRFPVLAGDYQLVISTWWHEDGIILASVPSATTVTEDATLTLRPTVEIAGLVRDRTAFNLLSDVRIVPQKVPVGGTVTAFGDFSLGQVPEGHLYPLLFDGLPGHGAGFLVVEIPPSAQGPQPPSGPFDVLQWIPATSEDFESGPGGFTADTTLWSHGVPMAGGPPSGFDGTQCWGIGMTGDYDDDERDILTSPVYDFSSPAPPHLYLSFHYWSETEDTFDGVNVEVWNDPVWEVRAPLEGYSDAFLGGLDYGNGWSGHTDDWVGTVFDLTDLIGPNVQFRFVWGSDGGVTDAGFWIDGIAFDTGSGVTGTPSAAAPSIGARLVAFPNPASASTTISWQLETAGRVSLDVLDLRGGLVTRLHDGPATASGSVTWNGTDARGRRLSRGIYWARLQTDAGESAVQRLVLAD